MFKANRLQVRNEKGLTLLEVMAAVVVASLVAVAAYSLFGSSVSFFTRSASDAVRVSDTMNAYWTLESLAQKASDVGTETLTSNNSGQYVSGATNGSVPLLALRVKNLNGIVPQTSAVYQAAAAGDFIAVGVIPVGGVPKLCLFPGGDSYNPTAQPAVYPSASDVTPIETSYTNFRGTQFVVLAPGGLPKSVQFQAIFLRKVSGIGTYTNSFGSNLQNITFQFMIGPYNF